jgi:hypothetical protein
MRDYEEEVARMPRRKPTAREAQEWRYGSDLDKKRHALRQAVFGYIKWVASSIPIAAALSSILKVWWWHS